MKILCPDCKKKATLYDDFSFVKCDNCGFEMTYGQYIRYIGQKDSRYSNILSDYREKNY
jgi:ribosomal protein L37AE/L43A